ncbi:hypothetical protein [Rhodocyclus tenuis]|uniref:hypothetical protein n=1 Tax=Rhodocyclus tenuis TaxID=1066 RepID=UPI0019076212|nr:hypothetical protein [Rhodocyclus tenuis]MBK1680099.1 hypothetical protein [Rhodocyclus tenuis]
MKNTSIDSAVPGEAKLKSDNSSAHGAGKAASAEKFPPRRELAEQPPAAATEVPASKPGRHKVSAIYPTRNEAETVCQRLSDGGIDFCTVDSAHEQPLAVIEDSSDEVLKEVLVDGAIGTAIGTGVGVIGTAVLWASGAALFIASPVVAPLALLGWFASIGGVVGAVTGSASTPEAGTTRKEGKFSELVMDAIKAGNVVLIARPRDHAESELAKKIIADSLRGRDKAASEFVAKT